MPRPRRKGRERFHLLRPDYDRPIYRLPPQGRERVREQLFNLYGKEKAEEFLPEVERLMKVHHAYKSRDMLAWEEGFHPEERFTEEDVILITYGDFIRRRSQSPLDTLVHFCDTHLRGTVNTLHILPFFPYSSDRGFAVIDFEEVDPQLGTWDDIDELKADFRLMFDGVFNHVSSQSRWFQEFLDGNPGFQDFFIGFSTQNAICEDHLCLIVRPRLSSILSEYSTINGKKWVWTTFSPDQIDLNYKNPKVLRKMIHVLLTYIRRGADIIRLDAATYLWAELGTQCAHLAQTHSLIKLLRAVMDHVAPVAALITETNVPHEANVSYFGTGSDEAHMVYNFALPPLVLHAFQTENASRLSRWASGLKHVSPTATYFNFLDSHDGIGLTPVKDILSPQEIEMLALRAMEHGGYISYKDNGDGTSCPYEINITWYSAMNREDAGETDDFQIKRFLASRSIALVMMGVPGIYLHSFLGSKNDADAVLAERETRSINRKVIDAMSLRAALYDPQSTTYKVSTLFGDMIRQRVKELAFHPNAPQKILNLGDEVFAVLRIPQDDRDAVLAITNVTSHPVALRLDPNRTGIRGRAFRDVLSNRVMDAPDGFLQLSMEPYEVLWLKTA